MRAGSKREAATLVAAAAAVNVNNSLRFMAVPLQAILYQAAVAAAAVLLTIAGAPAGETSKQKRQWIRPHHRLYTGASEMGHLGLRA
jgi:hypothetical protein